MEGNEELQQRDEKSRQKLQHQISTIQGMIKKTEGEISELEKRGLDYEGLRSAVEQYILAVEKHTEKLDLLIDAFRSMPKGIWSVKEAAEKLGLSQQHLRLLLKNGEVKGKKMGGTWVVLELSYTRKKKLKGTKMAIPSSWDQPITFETETE